MSALDTEAPLALLVAPTRRSAAVSAVAGSECRSRKLEPDWGEEAGLGSVAWRVWLTAITLAISLAVPCSGWEADLHYGLTHWLARKAGFSTADARAIAKGNLDRDSAFFQAPAVVALHVLILGNRDASTLVRDNHFPSEGDLPGPPDSRFVRPGSHWAQRRIIAEIRNRDPEPRQTTWESIGHGLHALQDSWSHRGIPDSPFRPARLVNQNLSWAHPEKRGGWRRHWADHTNRYPDDAVAAAAATYDKLLALLRTYSERRQDGSQGCPIGEPWSELNSKVNDFADARTKTEKRKWFESDPCVPPDDYGNGLEFLDSITLDGGPNFGPGGPREFFDRILNRVEALVAETVEGFLQALVVDRNPQAALEYVDVESVAVGLAGKAAKDRAEEITGRIVAMWLLADHGMVDRLGHGSTELDSFWDLPYERQTLGDYDLISAESLEQAVLLYNAVELEPHDGRRATHAVLMQFAHAPRDGVALLIDSAADEPKIVQLYWATI